MSERPNPDYVDRCIDFISSGRQRCFADLALWSIIIGAILMVSSYERDAGTGNRAWKNVASNSPTPAALASAAIDPATSRNARIGSLLVCRKALIVHRPGIGETVSGLKGIGGIDHQLLRSDDPGAAGNDRADS